MKHLLYRTTNQINQNFYIGVHSTQDKNDSYIGSGKRLWKAIYKYGKENFEKEILAILSSKKLAFDLEKFVVTQEMVDNPNCYNITLGGEHPTVPTGKNHPHFGLKGVDHFNYGRSFNKETKEKISDSLKEFYKDNESPFKGRNHSKESLEKISESLNGRNLTKDHCDKISERTKGKGNPFFGKSHTQESKNKMCEAHKSRTKYSGKAVVHLSSGKEFNSIAEASRKMEMNVGNVGAHCRGNREIQKFKFKKDLG